MGSLAIAKTVRGAVADRRKRLETWRRERVPHAAPDDPIVQWIDRELAQSADGAIPRSYLIPVRVPRSDIRGLDRPPAGTERLIASGVWVCKLPEPESMAIDELRAALEAARRLRAADAGVRSHWTLAAVRRMPAARLAQSVSLDGLLPPAPEAENVWAARRAASELAIDPDLRFLRFQDTVLPDSGTGGLPAGAGMATAMSELKRMLDLDQGQRQDPLVEKLKTVASKGRAGAVVTRLQIAADMSNVTVETALWIRIGSQWAQFGSRNASVRPEDLGADAGKGLGDDPQIQGAFKIVESLGPGSNPRRTQGAKPAHRQRCYLKKRLQGWLDQRLTTNSNRWRYRCQSPPISRRIPPNRRPGTTSCAQ